LMRAVLPHHPISYIILLEVGLHQCWIYCSDFRILARPHETGTVSHIRWWRRYDDQAGFHILFLFSIREQTSRAQIRTINQTIQTSCF
jgi:hypothetical protein